MTAFCSEIISKDVYFLNFGEKGPISVVSFRITPKVLTAHLPSPKHPLDSLIKISLSSQNSQICYLFLYS